MGTHKDFHFVRAMHHHRERAKEAEDLLRKVYESCDSRWCPDTMERIHKYLEGDK